MEASGIALSVHVPMIDGDVAVRNRYRHAWYAWGAAFVVLEVVAYRSDHEEATLSRNVWTITRSHPTKRVALGAFMAWLTYHMVIAKTSGRK